MVNIFNTLLMSPNGNSGGGALITSLIIIVVIFFVARELFTWYWKINKIVQLLENIEKKLSDNSDSNSPKINNTKS